MNEADDFDHKALVDVHREATSKVIRKVLLNEPSIERRGAGGRGGVWGRGGVGLGGGWGGGEGGGG